ncbi:response regulator transcription factor [Bacillus toyonensis]|uniref:DNA-binding response regulator n=1 Tax=Bacillus toyonensis TaxID=155322 RepID=A0A2C4ME67_9BACI|nr:response regulator transcription factor [Bacillus toyonensis]PEJ82208.1 DNA-binding response regulator [Bacillus toyonensis]PEK72281.1 DNA-binding response regulator [Bacillus toyonensis]PEL15803.1 DNA-binding response regulator [Bacillus toyonensis]PEO45457.1 DNA-binding response regulator [Bacillus toyonensis]PFY27880.1 DNA-binding response regulator [Bacillus toyonensis]
MNPNILIINNNVDNQEYIQNLLIKQKFTIDTENDGIEGIIRFQKKVYDLVILDAMSPNLDGYSICKIIRSQSTVPIIMLSTVKSESAEIKGFQFGIDDFITSPFSFELFCYRIEAILRRNNSTKLLPLIQFQEISLNPDSYIVYLNGQKKKLTTKEFDMLHIFLKNPGKVLSREFLLNHVWGYDYYGDPRVIDAYVKKIRKKLNIPYIKTVTGVGYKIDT